MESRQQSRRIFTQLSVAARRLTEPNALVLVFRPLSDRVNPKKDHGNRYRREQPIQQEIERPFPSAECLDEAAVQREPFPDDTEDECENNGCEDEPGCALCWFLCFILHELDAKNTSRSAGALRAIYAFGYPSIRPFSAPALVRRYKDSQ